MEFLTGITTAVGDFASKATRKLKDLLPKVKHGVFDNAGVTNLFPLMGVMSASVSNDKKIASHPLENGELRQDNVVVEPRTATVVLAGESRNIKALYNVLGQLYRDNTLVSVVVDGLIYKNMIVASIPIERSPDKYDLVELPVVFKSFIFTRTKVSAMADPKNVKLAEYTSRQKAGMQEGTQVSGASKISTEGGMTIPSGRGR